MLIHVPTYLQAIADVEAKFNEKTRCYNRDWGGDENVVADAFWETLDELIKGANDR